MQLFFHDVGIKGANSDFPKTVFGDVAIADIVERCPIHLQAEIENELSNEFPEGWCNVWGVPEGAKSIIRQLSVGDVMLLIKTTGGNGEMPALCHVRSFWKEPLLDLSDFLWGSSHFPYIFFFKTQPINLTWFQFKQDVQYLPKFRPAGNVYRVKSDRLESFGGPEGYVKHLTQCGYNIENSHSFEIRENSPQQDYEEGERHVRESYYFKRNAKLVQDAKNKYGFKCQICGFDFESFYGAEIGSGFIECHHKNPLSEKDENYKSTLDDVCVVCSNCHRILHRTKPAMKPEELIERLRRTIGAPTVLSKT